MNNCYTRSCQGSSCLSLIVSIVAAAAAGVIYYFLLPEVTALLWILFGVGALALTLLSIGSVIAAHYPDTALARCLCRHGGGLLASAVATVLAATALLTVFAVVSLVARAILLAIVVLFFVYMVLRWGETMYCIARSGCSCRCDCEDA